MRATLKLYAQTTSTDAVEAQLAKTSTWSESTLKLSNEPGAQTAVLARSSGTTAGAWTSSAAVTQNVTVAFVLSVPTGAVVSFASKEAGAATAPALSVTYDAPVVPPSGTKALLGMSSPDNLWAQRVSEVGPGLQARRLFFSDFNASLGLAQQACNDHMYPILSFKTGSYSWAQVAAGNADAALRSLATRVAALSCDAFVAIHHEPAQDGAAADWAAMQVHALPLVGGPIGGKVKVGVIGNGWWWSAAKNGYRCRDRDLHHAGSHQCLRRDRG